MGKVQSLVRLAKGLSTFPNRLHLPEGSLVQADNVAVEKDGTVSKVRGFNRYGQQLSASGIEGLFEYEDTLLLRDGNTLKRDSDGAGTWAAYGGTYSRPETGVRVRSVEANGVLLFTSSKGIMRTDALTSDPVKAGIPAALAPVLAKTGIGGGWFLVDSQVRYRIVWGRIDEKNNLFIGAPSFPEDLVNAKVTGLAWARTGAGPYTITVTHTAHGFSASDIVEISDASVGSAILDGAHTVVSAPTADTYTFTVASDPGASGTCSDGKNTDASLTIPIPDDVVEGDLYEVYRTTMSAAATSLPGDEHYKVFRGGVTAADITAGYVTFTDVYDENFLGVDLYTNQNQQGITQQNSRPPWAKDIALFNGFTWFANTKKPQVLLLQLLTVAGVEDNVDTVAFTLGATTRTYTFSTAEDQGTNKFKRSTGGLDSENVRDTAKSLVKIINGDTGNSLLYAYYASGDDDPPGFIALEAREPNTAVFSLTVNAGTPAGVWSPELPTSGTDVSSDDDAGPNRIYHSKYQEPEHVPDFNYEELGGRSNQILRILPLRDSLIALCSEGVWRITGDTESSLTYKQLDPSTRLWAPGSAVVLNNAVYCLTTQGVVRITESGTAIISRQIEEDLKRLFDTSIPSVDFSQVVFAEAYESERKFFLYAPLNREADCTGFYIYDYITQEWTLRRHAASAAHVMKTADRLYISGVSDEYVLKERKSFGVNDEALDYQDEDVPVVLDAVDTTTDANGNTVSRVRFEWNESDSVLSVGDYLSQGAGKYGWATSVVEVPTVGWVVTLDRYIAGLATGAATLTLSIPSTVEWAPETGGNPGALKQFMYAQVYLSQQERLDYQFPFQFELGFASDLDSTVRWLDPYSVTEAEYDGGVPLRAVIPQQCQYGRALNVYFRHRRARETFDIANLTVTLRSINDVTAKGAA